MAARASLGALPWDAGCRVTPLIGGYEAMSAMRDALKGAVAEAQGGSPGKGGRVYIAGWRFNCLRDLSDTNPWGTGPWQGGGATSDETAIGLVLRLMQAGVQVRILVWLPTKSQRWAGKFGPHVEDHRYLARLVATENDRLVRQFRLTEPLGVVALDARTAEGPIIASGAHHQKMMVIRGAVTSVAFCGGVDLAFTRRDAPENVTPASGSVNAGDWQSGDDTPGFALTWSSGGAKLAWPPDGATAYGSVATVKAPSDRQGSDLPGLDPTTKTAPFVVYGQHRQKWHDQHLKMEGPIVASLEHQFVERWSDSADCYDLAKDGNWMRGQVIFSTPAAFTATPTGPLIQPLPLVAPEPAVAGGGSTVQMWRTIPWRDSRTGSPFTRAEFTVMAGVAKAALAASELVWIFDQYFWSVPFARLLHERVVDPKAGLHVIVVLPPYADDHYELIHRARMVALNELVTADMSVEQRSRVAVYDMWDHRTETGIYCHAKVQMYDGDLLVCGSANLNRRSFNCDSELACAVLDPEVVADHQRKLWNLLFGDTGKPWPGLDLSRPGSGAAFLDAFREAASLPTAFLRPDPWQENEPKLPNGVDRKVAGPGLYFWGMYNKALDPTSIDPADGDVVHGNRRPARLDDIVNRIETTYRAKADGTVSSPWRKQS